MIDRRHNLSGEEFRSTYLRTKTPVLIEGRMADWPAMTLWTKEYITNICGNQTIEVMANRDSNPLFEVQSDKHKTQMRFKDFAEVAFSTEHSNNLYLVANNQFINTPSGVRLMQDVKHMPEYLHSGSGGTFLWIGPGGTITPLHHDVLDIILTQVRGSKRIRLFAPEQKSFLYNSIGVFSDVDVEQPNFEKFPLYRYAEPIEFDLRPGEMLYLPDGHWHQVHSLEPSISISFTNFIR
jgi:ribosomal protein L16 Arg81 hydroxylase